MRKWTCPTSEEWGRYLLERDPKDRPMFEKHLAVCPYCRFTVKQLTGELQSVTRAWNSKTVQPVYYYTMSPMTLPEIEYGPHLLAAQGNNKPDRPDSIALTTPDNKFLLKAVFDSHTGDTWLYLSSDDPESARNVLIRPFGQTGEYITDDRGRVNLGKIDWPDPSRHTAEIRLPRATFVLAPPADEMQKGEVTRLTSPAGDTIRLTFSGEGRNRKLEIDIVNLANREPGSPVRIALRGPDVISIMPLSADAEPKAFFEKVRAEGKLEIYLYQ
ncbi:MAG: hypothetical protein GYA46_07450 [candidate division Zixibacteria bacterium]|nr:hypothetical protein [candidate division Zixibacteria bacterium]